jgi:hypothetical protein
MQVKLEAWSLRLRQFEKGYRVTFRQKISQSSKIPIPAAGIARAQQFSRSIFHSPHYLATLFFLTCGIQQHKLFSRPDFRSHDQPEFLYQNE